MALHEYVRRDMGGREDTFKKRCLASFMSLESLSGTSCDTFQLDGGLEKAIFGSLATPVELSGEEACKSGPMTKCKLLCREGKAYVCHLFSPQVLSPR